MSRETRGTLRQGFTLIEMLVALTVSVVVVAALFSVVLAAQRQYAVQRETRSAEESLRVAEQVLRTILQVAGADPRGTGQGLLDPNPLGHSAFDNVRVRSDFNPPDGDFADELEDVLLHVQSDTLLVRWRAGGATSPLAYPVRSVRFRYYDRNGTLIPTADAVGNAKSVSFVLSAPDDGTLLRRETWVFIQNRRP